MTELICVYCGCKYFADVNKGTWRKNNLQQLGKGGVSPKLFCSFKCGMRYRNDKKQITFLNHYGVLNNFSRKEIQKTAIIHLKTVECSLKKKQTCLEKYGKENPSQIKEIQLKKEKTCLKHFGIKHGFLLEKAKLKRKTIESKRKEYETKKKNKTINTSKVETDIYDILKTRYKKVERQYYSEKYPFACDFYVPELDLYIEYQGTWMHGKEPFDKTNKKHQKIINEWKKKAQEINFKGNFKKSFLWAIEVWTKRDPLKRVIAKENNLNWIEFFNINQFNNWFDKENKCQI